jgi:hypothetical protein
VKDAVAVLKSPKLEGGQLTFDVVVLEGDLANTRPDLRHCSSTGSRPVADLAAWVLSVASAFMPQSGMLAGMPTLELHLQQELQSVQLGSPQRGPTPTRLQRAAITPIRLVTSPDVGVCNQRPT